MIETEDQRRWWFATHPEYSWSATGQRRSKQPTRDEDPLKQEFLRRMMTAGEDGRKRLEEVWEKIEAYRRITRPFEETISVLTNLGRAIKLLRAARRIQNAVKKPRPPARLPPKGTPERAKIEVVKKSGTQAEKAIEADLTRGGMNPRDYRLVKFKDKHVAQRDSTFDSYQKNPDGRINLDWIRDGNCPLDKSGDYVVLHHTKQRNAGPMIEVTTAEHNRIGRRYDPSVIDRPEAKRFRRRYWRERAKSFSDY